MINLGDVPVQNGTYRYPCGNFVVVEDGRFVYIYYANDDRIWLATVDGEYKVIRVKTYDGYEFVHELNGNQKAYIPSKEHRDSLTVKSEFDKVCRRVDVG